MIRMLGPSRGGGVRRAVSFFKLVRVAQRPRDFRVMSFDLCGQLRPEADGGHTHTHWRERERGFFSTGSLFYACALCAPCAWPRQVLIHSERLWTKSNLTPHIHPGQAFGGQLSLASHTIPGTVESPKKIQYAFQACKLFTRLGKSQGDVHTHSRIALKLA